MAKKVELYRAYGSNSADTARVCRGKECAGNMELLRVQGWTAGQQGGDIVLW